MNILFYQPYNQATNYIESIVEQLASRGNSTFFLSHDEKGPTHSNMEIWGTKTFSSTLKKKLKLVYYIRRIIELVRFCRAYKIEIVYSHYQEANLIAVFSQYFCKARFILTRHHTDCAFIDNNWKEKWADKIINQLAHIQIAPSLKVYRQIVDEEHTNSKKVILINYGYNFNNIPMRDSIELKKIRTEYSAKLLLITAARLIPEKRHELLINEINQLVNTGLDIKLLILGKGPLKQDINSQIINLGLEKNIFLLGFKTNIMDYFAAADLIVHFSQSEASNSAIKEAALTETPVMVCHDVGDFDDYIVDGKNGFSLDKETPGRTFSVVIRKILKAEYDLSQIGSLLHQEIKNRFDIDRVIDQYIQFNKSKR